MILDLYRQLKEIADEEYDEVVENTEIIFSYTGRARKLRIKLIDNTFPKHCHDGTQENVVESNL